MKIFVLASGSKGNATFIDFGGTGVLIDCGITKKKLLLRLSELGYGPDDVHYVFLTHDHVDHNKNIHIFGYDILYAAKGCCDNLDENHYLEPYTILDFDSFKMIPLQTSHDATNSIGFEFFFKDERLIYMTDTGYVSKKNAQYMQDCDYYIMESNHDIDMLWNSKRPKFLIQRILSDRGHLSNLDSANMMTRLVGPNTKEIILAHLSDECNTPELAIKAYKEAFERRGLSLDSIRLLTAGPDTIIRGGNIDEN